MSTEYYTPREWVTGAPAREWSMFGTSSNGRFRWAPDWYEGDWNNPEVQDAFIRWLEEHPAVLIPTDQRARSAASVLLMLRGARLGPTTSDAVDHLRRLGWLP